VKICHHLFARAYGKGGLGWKSPLELDILQKLCYLRKGDELVSHTFCLLICMQISRNIVNGSKSNTVNKVLVGISVVVCIQKPTYHILQTFRPLRMFMIVFRDRSLYPKHLSLFCLLWLSSASADRIGYITCFCNMIKLLHELKNSSC